MRIHAAAWCLSFLAALALVGFLWAHAWLVVLLVVAVGLSVAVAAKEGRLPHQRRRQL